MEKSFYSRARFLSASFFVAAFFLGGSFLISSFAQAAVPSGFIIGSYGDADNDGTVDHIIVGIDSAGEDLTTCNVSAGEVASDWTYNGGAIGGTLGSATCVLIGEPAITFQIVGANEGVTGADPGPTISYANGDADNSIANASGSLAGGGPLELNDYAAPFLLQTSINDNAILGRYDDVMFLFSENVSQLDISLYLGSTLRYTVDDASPYVVWMDEKSFNLNFPPLSGGSYTLQDFAFEDGMGNPGVVAISDPLPFRVRSLGDDDAAPETSTPDSSVAVLTPAEGEWISSGSVVDVTWSSSVESASYATLSYSLDNGSTWMEIVRNTLNDGAYAWMTPSVEADEAMVKVVLTDLADEIASDTSEAFVLSSAEASDDVQANIDGVVAGSFIKTSGSPTIYYVDEDMSRRPFFDAQTYFTYEDDFDAVTEVSSNTLAKFSIGAPMMPKPGVVLVKIQSVAKVYMVEEAADGSYELRWITSEEVAEDMFGSQWSSYVLDVDATLFTRYEMGDDVTDADDESVDRDMMKMRMHLHE
jgi:hypothetical protein